jgi:uncharacterized protein YecT (DUF1311 family)
MTRLSSFAVGVVSLLIAGPGLAKELPVQSVTIAKSGERLELSVAYPRTGLAAIDRDIAAWAKKTVADFKKVAEVPLPDPFNYGLDISFEVVRNDDAMFTVAFAEEDDTGGAHPNHDIHTFSYVRLDGWRVYLAEIFERDALQKISDLAIADLAGQLAGPDGAGDIDTIKDGAGPAWDNFQNFTLGADTLTIQFPPYQVASCAAGDQTTEIPLAKLKGLMRKNWRAPVASFDCAQAKSPTEKTICSDVGLARLDRGVAESYARKLRYAFEDAEKATVKQGQRDWIAARGAQCTSGALACLTAVYAARLAVLEAPPE